MSLIGSLSLSTINLKVKHWGSLNLNSESLPLCSTQWYSAGIPILANPSRGWRRGWTPDPRQIGDGTAIPDPRQIGDGGGDGDRGFRALLGRRTVAPVPEYRKSRELRVQFKFKLSRGESTRTFRVLTSDALSG
jgi:hypothetical protein